MYLEVINTFILIVLIAILCLLCAVIYEEPIPKIKPEVERAMYS
jgi:hypothetical protein